MASTIEETPIARKTRELCQTILEEPSVKALRQRIDSFMADEKTREQYDGLVAKGQALQEKQQRAVALTGEEISDFEQHRDALLKNPVARGFIDAQQELHEVQESIHVSQQDLRAGPPALRGRAQRRLLQPRRLRLRALGCGKELPAPPDLEPAGFGVHLDEDELLGGLAGADVRVAPVVPILHLGGDTFPVAPLPSGVVSHHQHRRLVGFPQIVDA